ncbi:hypothetical protein D3875_21125 [Deinococcus cavernae]|uniref:Uncharacterized protein n=1 Tax=Deinococcus cavernae TaxID=2320857 RepID=A0A418UZD9_9DEIO|nr:hypothetical protein D3875_21125 [Deinococcus cavernae]
MGQAADWAAQRLRRQPVVILEPQFAQQAVQLVGRPLPGERHLVADQGDRAAQQAVLQQAHGGIKVSAHTVDPGGLVPVAVGLQGHLLIGAQRGDEGELPGAADVGGFDGRVGHDRLLVGVVTAGARILVEERALAVGRVVACVQGQMMCASCSAPA